MLNLCMLLEFILLPCFISDMSHPWLVLQDVIGPKEVWPQFIVNYIWCSTLGYKERVVITSFCFQNGCHEDVLIDCLRRVNRYCTELKVKKIRDLYLYWTDPVEGFLRRSNYFAYSLHDRRVLDLNGSVRGDNSYQVGTRTEVYYQCPER